MMFVSSRVGPNPWLELEYFANPYNCHKYLLDTITTKNYLAMYSRNTIEKEEAKKEGVILEDFDIIKPNDSNLQDIMEDMSCAFLQAKDYYTAAENIPYRTRPVLLYYGMISLAKLLMSATYTYPQFRGVHGLSIERGGENSYERAQIKPEGFFPRFVTSYINRSAGYSSLNLDYIEGDERYHYRFYRGIITQIKNKTFFSLDELLHSIKEIQDAWKEVYPWNADREKRLNEHGIDELSSHFIAMYILSMIARYRSTSWANILEGRSRGDAFVIKRFLDCSFYRFPLLILNELKVRKEQQVVAISLYTNDIHDFIKEKGIDITQYR
ncbi:MAG: YaaC family protein [Nanoarchaeota archaeon]|nr:YaaC family protein [Nanoarchaeota archaeon]MCG2718268.1 YaaC family protein [Nanoarchaeota archaeon]